MYVDCHDVERSNVPPNSPQHQVAEVLIAKNRLHSELRKYCNGIELSSDLTIFLKMIHF